MAASYFRCSFLFFFLSVFSLRSHANCQVLSVVSSHANCQVLSVLSRILPQLCQGIKTRLSSAETNNDEYIAQSVETRRPIENELERCSAELEQRTCVRPVHSQRELHSGRSSAESDDIEPTDTPQAAHSPHADTTVSQVGADPATAIATTACATTAGYYVAAFDVKPSSDSAIPANQSRGCMGCGAITSYAITDSAAFELDGPNEQLLDRNIGGPQLLDRKHKAAELVSGNSIDETTANTGLRPTAGLDGCSRTVDSAGQSDEYPKQQTDEYAMLQPVIPRHCKGWSSQRVDEWSNQANPTRSYRHCAHFFRQQQLA